MEEKTTKSPKCEGCAFSHKIIFENGYYHYYCILPEKDAIDCILNIKDNYQTS